MNLISIIIPTYNRPIKLKRAITSIINQTYINFEILIINDSKIEEDVKEVIKSFNDKRIKYFCNSRTKGPSGARNTGILKSKGKFIAFLDDDDEWLPKKLELQIKLLNSRSNHAVFCAFKILNNKKWTNIIQKNVKHNQKNYLLHKYEVCASSTILIKKSVLNKMGLFSENLSINEDLEFILRLLREHNITYISKILVKIYGHCIRDATKTEKNKKVFFNMINNDLKKLTKTDKKHFFSLNYRDLATLFSNEGNFKKTKYYLKRSLKLKILKPQRYIKIILNFMKFKLKINLIPVFEKYK